MTDEDATSLISHAEQRQSQTDHREMRRVVREGLKQCSKAMSRGGPHHYAAAADHLRSEVLPALYQLADQRLVRYGEHADDADSWHWQSLRSFLRDPDEYITQLHSSTGTNTGRASALTDGRHARSNAAKRTVRESVETVATIAELEEIVSSDLKSRVDAVGFHAKVGEHLQDAEMDFGDPVRLITEQSGALKTLFAGGTGQGKSATAEAEFEDYLHINTADNSREMKLIDPAGLRDGENWFYDIPQQDDDLRRIRREMGLPESFADDPDAPDRNIEILLPLTPGLPDEPLPFDTESEQFTVRPFTIPASEIGDLFLVNLLSTRLTDREVDIIWDALDEVKHDGGDWALKDLANEIRNREDLSASKKRPPVRTLKHLQNLGFIRTSRCEHTLDWEDVFRDTETITVFSQSKMDDEIGRLTAFGYIIESIVNKREHLSDAPECALLMRELWKVVPHRRRQSFDPRAAELQEAIGYRFTQLFRENRHFGVHILGDTQYVRDLMKAVRELFNRYVLFNVNRDTVESVFEWTANDRSESFYRTITPKKGIASVVGQVEPAVERKATEFVGPVQYAPPSHHHRITDVDSNGWTARCKYLDREELRRARHVDGVEWNDEVPTRLQIADDSGSTDGTDPATNPVAAFAQECLTTNTSDAVQRKKVYTAYNAWAHEHPDLEGMERDFSSSGTASSFGSELHSALEADLGRTARDGENAWKGLELTGKGKKYYSMAMDGLEDAAAPIRAD